MKKTKEFLKNVQYNAFVFVDFDRRILYNTDIRKNEMEMFS